MNKDHAKQSALMKMEAAALFAGFKARTMNQTWWYWAEMLRLGRSVNLSQSISPYRASLHCDYMFCGIDCQLYLECESHLLQVEQRHWTLSYSSIEGKVNAQRIHDALKPLQQQGFIIPVGNENLERQMNFSLGLYGACLMHVDVQLPTDRLPLLSVTQVMNHMETINRAETKSLAESLLAIDQQRAQISSHDEDQDPDIIMGDWQTWK